MQTIGYQGVRRRLEVTPVADNHLNNDPIKFWQHWGSKAAEMAGRWSCLARQLCVSLRMFLPMCALLMPISRCPSAVKDTAKHIPNKQRAKDQRVYRGASQGLTGSKARVGSSICVWTHTKDPSRIGRASRRALWNNDESDGQGEVRAKR
ncbi:hypothetical protein Ddc_16824 [Ditylenchus destructor]|nr:hypothetical protein Ddc_16824 [Ditylenchus destructor]